MTLFHDLGILPYDDHFGLDRFRVISPYNYPFLIQDSMWVGAQDAVWIRMLYPDYPFYVPCENSCE